MPNGDPNSATFQSPTTGVSKALPSEQWDDALKAGYKPTDHTVMYSPEGQRGLVPNEQMADFTRQGYQTTPKTQFEQQRTPQEGFWQGVKNEASNLMPTWKQAAVSAVEGPFAPLVSGVQSALNARQNWQNQTAQGRSPIYKAITGAADLAGIPTGHQGEEEAASHGDVAGVAGHAAVPAALAAAPLVGEGIGRLAGKAQDAIAASRYTPEGKLTPGAKLINSIRPLGVPIGGAVGYAADKLFPEPEEAVAARNQLQWQKQMGSLMNRGYRSAEPMSVQDLMSPSQASEAPSGSPDDLISRTRALVKPGEEPTAADLKRAGDLTQAPLPRLKQLAKWGDKLAQNEINRRLQNP